MHRRRVASLLLVAACGSKSLGGVETMGDGEDGSASSTMGTSTQGQTAGMTGVDTAETDGTDDVGETGSETEGDGSSTGVYVCDNPLGEGVIDDLTWGHGPNNALGVRPGGAYYFELGFPSSEGSSEGIPNLCVEWAVDPPGAATVAYGIANGDLIVADDVEPGEVITVIADVENGRAIVELPTTVYTSETHPQVSNWHEVGWIACSDGTELPTDGEGRFVRLTADNRFDAIPEVAPIVWGTYAFDIDSGELTLMDDGQSGAMDFDGEGTITFEDDRAWLHDLWMSEIPRPADVCGQIFD